MNPLQAPTISICFGTLQRAEFIARAIPSARRACGNLSFEFVISDGGSTDGTLEFLRSQPDVTLLEIGERTGAVDAFNRTFKAARGEFVAALNDDLESFGTPLASAVKLLRADPTIGQVALPFLTHPVAHASEIPARVTGTPYTQTVPLPTLGSVPYANFGVIRRALGEQLFWWGNSGEYFQYAGDTELSTKVWYHGLRVVALDAKEGYLIHYQARDDTRVPNVETDQYNKRWRGADSPFYKLEKNKILQDAVKELERIAPQGLPPFSRHMKDATLLRFRGGQAGKIPYTPPNSTFNYSVSAGEPLVWVDGKDVAWLLGLTQGRAGKLFERVQ